MSFVYNLLKTVSNNYTNISKTIKYNTKGAALIKKNFISTEELQKLAAEFNLPKGITSGQYARVGQNFDAAKNYTDILSFYNDEGKLVLRLQDIYKDSLNLSTTVKQYTYPKVWMWDKYNSFVKIIKTTLQNNKVVQKVNEFQQIYKKKDGLRAVAIGKVERQAGNGQVCNETQSAIQYSNMEPAKGYKLRVKHNSNGENCVNGIETIGDTRVNPKDPYLSAYLYERDDFAKSAYVHALERNGLNSPELAPELDISAQKLLQSKSRGEYSYSDEVVRLNPLMDEKIEIVNNENHELYHHVEFCMQEQLLGTTAETPAKKLAYVKKYGRELSPSKQKLAEMYDQNWRNYIKSSDDYAEYLEQPVEAHARNKGREAAEEFAERRNYLFGQLPYFVIN